MKKEMFKLILIPIFFSCCSVSQSSLGVIEKKIKNRQLFPMEDNSHRYWKFVRNEVKENNLKTCAISGDVFAEKLFVDTLNMSEAEKATADLFYLHATCDALSIFKNYKVYKYINNRNLGKPDFKHYIEYKIQYKNDTLQYIFDVDNMPKMLRQMDSLLTAKAFYCIK